MHADVIVVGAGVMGAATARSLARTGHSVALLDRFTVGHAHGSSHGPSRIFRASYPHERYAAMAMQALPLWRTLEEESGVALLSRVGGVNLGGDLARLGTAMRAARVAFERRSGAQAMERYPAIAIPEDASVLVEPGAAVIEADVAVRALLESARRHGADLMEGAQVTALREATDGVEVVLGSGPTLRARVVVVTVGPWVGEFAAASGIPVDAFRVTRETVGYFARGGADVPILLDWREPLRYALPSRDGTIKAGEHVAGPTVRPDDAKVVDRGSIARVSGWIAEIVPGADPSPRAAETCLYTNTPDGDFILKRTGRIVVGSACSGHGFKFAPIIGNRLASLATS